MERLDAVIISLLKDHNVSEELIYESVNKTLLKHGGKNKSEMFGKKIETKRKRKRVVCRPALLISDSSDDD